MKINANKLVHASLIAGAVFAANNSIALEQFFNVPGTRAMAMSGAFIATAGDSTALWYNPAGLAKLSDSIDFTIEQGDITQEEPDATWVPNTDRYVEDSDVKYIAVAGGGMGLAYFKPYKFFNTANYTNNGTTFTAEIETELSELKYGFGTAVADSVRIGGTLDMIFKEADINQIGSNTNDDDLSQLEFGFSLGLQGDLALDDMVMKGHKFSYGLMYRSGTDSNAEDDVYTDKVKGVPGRPEAVNYGIGYSAPLPVVLGVPLFLTFNYEIDNLVYEGILNITSGTGNAESDLEETKKAWGLELQMFPSFMKNGSLFLRYGSANVDVDAVDNPSATIVNEFDVQSFGVGVRLGNWVVDFAKETRDITANPSYNVPDQELDLTAISVSYGF